MVSLMRVHEPDNPQSGQHALLVVNQLGASSYTDAGRDAVYLGEYFDLTTIAIDRPGSAFGFRPGLGKRLERHYTSEYDRTARKVAKQLDTLGITKVLIMGRSVGGSGALAFTHTDRLPVTSLAVFEPIGWQALSVPSGKSIRRHYMAEQRAILDDKNKEIVRPQPSGLPPIVQLGRLGLMAAHTYNDIHNNSLLWAAGQARESALYIAKYMPAVAASITFASRSLAAYLPHILEGAHDLTAVRRESGLQAQPFDIVVWPHTVHASFDNRDFLNEQLSHNVGKFLLR